MIRSRDKRDDRFDGYGVKLYVDDEGDWLAHFEEMPNISAFGPTPEAALRELNIAQRLVKESYAADGKPVPVPPSRRHYSGQFNVRIDQRVHGKLAIEAERSGLTLNALVARKLAAAVGE